MLPRCPVFLLALPLLAPLVPAQVAGAPFTFEDLVRLERLVAVDLSPDGKHLCVQRAVPDPDRNTLTSALWLVETQSGAARPLTFPPPEKGWRDSDCRFAPDGHRLAFLSDRDGTPQLYLLDLRGGEAQQLTRLPGGAADPVWTPDGRAVLVRASVHPDCPPYPEGEACERRRTEQRQSSPLQARVIDRLLYRHWDRWLDDRRQHVLQVPVDPPGRPVDRTPGDRDAPAVARSGPRPYALSPDGRELAVVEHRDRDLATSTNTDIFLWPIGADPRRATAHNLTQDNRASDASPRYSPNGRYLAYLAQKRPGFEADRWVLWLYDRSSRTRRPLTEALDAHVSEPVWAPDSQRLYFTTSLKGRGRIYVVDVDGGPPEEVATAEAHDLAVRPGLLVYRGSSLSRPDEVYRLPLDRNGRAAGPPVRVTTVTAPLDRFSLGQVTELWTQTADGLPLHSWLVLPPQRPPDRRAPAVVLIHGGPQGAWEDAWHLRWNAQAYAGAGYVVLLPNVRGSEGFGQLFIDQVSGSWGGLPYEDLLRAVDQLRAHPAVDPRRIGALGASYGGYLVNWLATHSDRFAALVSHNGVWDLRSMHGETEELWFPRWEFGGDPWSSDQYDRWSPSRFAARLRTPMLVIASEKDYRVPMGQGMQLFTALQLQRVPSRMIIFPDEGHWVQKPGNARFWYASVLDWLHRYLGGARVDRRLLQLQGSHVR